MSEAGASFACVRCGEQLGELREGDCPRCGLPVSASLPVSQPVSSDTPVSPGPEIPVDSAATLPQPPEPESATPWKTLATPAASPAEEDIPTPANPPGAPSVPLHGYSAPSSVPLYGGQVPPGYPPYPYASPGAFPPYAPGVPVGYPFPTPTHVKRSEGLIIGIVVAVLAAVILTSTAALIALIPHIPTSVYTRAPTPLPTATRAATPVEYVTFEDPLTAQTHNWTVDAHCFFSSDGYHIKDGRICFAPAGRFWDQSIHVRLSPISSISGNGYGVALRYQSDGQRSGYFFALYPGGRWQFYKAVNDVVTTLARGASVAIGDTHASNDVKISALGDDFVFVVNGTRLGEVHDATFDLGYVGLFAHSGAEALFTDLHIAVLA